MGKTLEYKVSSPRYAWTFVVISLHDTILGPSCVVRCPGTTESLVFLSLYISFVRSLISGLMLLHRLHDCGKMMFSCECSVSNLKRPARSLALLAGLRGMQV